MLTLLFVLVVAVAAIWLIKRALARVGAIMKLVSSDDAVLHQPAAEVQPEEIATAEFKEMVAALIRTMYASAGCGIAAPQVGIGKRVCVAGWGGALVLINPVITARSEACAMDMEGCLSLPLRTGIVKRHEAITVQALDMDGQPQTIEADGFFARILQHEIDHLDGILYTDRIREQDDARRVT